jgi:hypothetical protein
MKKYIIVIALSILPFSIFSQEINYDTKNIFIREGFGFTYLQDELTSLSAFYKNHGQPMKIDEHCRFETALKRY